MKRLLAALVTVAALVGCSDMPADYETRVSASIAPGMPSQALLDRARFDATRFWHNQLGASGELLVGCAQGFHYRSDASMEKPRAGYASGCSTRSGAGGDYVPGPDPGPPAYITLNPHYRWNYAALCIIVTHEFGHLVEKHHTDNDQWKVMQTPAVWGTAYCPDP